MKKLVKVSLDERTLSGMEVMSVRSELIPFNWLPASGRVGSTGSRLALAGFVMAVTL